MVAHPYYHQCCQGIGRPVRITMRDGRVHHGIIDRVTPNMLYLRPLGGPRRNFGGYGYGELKDDGYGQWGWGWGFGTGFAFGAIATLAFLPFFLW